MNEKTSKSFTYFKKTLQVAVAIAFVFTVLISFSGFANLTKTCEDISQKVFRLHILANSDSNEDQTLKLQVRDRILEESQSLFNGTENKEQAMEQAKAKLPELQALAEDEIHKQGYDYPVTVAVQNVHFNTRQYDDVTLPAGNYDALQMKIGEAKGHNWWCVLFPSLCIPAANQVELDDVLNSSELDLVEGGGYEVKFKVVEWYEDIRSWLGGGQ